jgi:hypothetical protein
MLRAGWADIWLLSDFQRSPAYLPVAVEAERALSGVWDRCDGDFHFNRTDELREERLSAIAFIRRYYRRLSNDQYRSAWRMLGARRRAQVRSYRRWKAGYRGSLGVSVVAASVRLAGRRRAVVTVRLRARDRDVCSGGTVRQRFAGKVILAPRHGSWVIVKFQMRKTGGRTPRLSRSECPLDRGGGGGGRPNCQGYNPCLTPGPDVDCAGGSGNGPRYVNGPVQVNGSDPYGLDSDGDGVGCED